ncbi:MAG: thioredoxin domain-containing protein [Acidobacteria bacterium]|nr:thioredoxin domain-containing protein [Acidobacteriota bacterium]
MISNRVHVRAIGAVLALCLMSGGVWATKKQSKGGVKKETAQKIEVSTAPNKTLGSKSAPIMMEVFSDFQCPSCRELFLSTTKPLIDNYVNTGKVYLIHRDMPLAMHQYSRVAARYANAAAFIGRFEAAADALYSAQATWSVNGKIEETLAKTLTPAEMVKVRELVKSGKVEPFIEKDFKMGQEQKVGSTPSVFITYKGKVTPLPPGGVTYSLLRQYLDSLLSQ